MQHTWSLESLQLKNSWVTIGSFDGVHLGHQKIVQKLIAGAHLNGSPAVVLTFYPHPSIVLGKRNGSFYLSTPEERAQLLGELGVDVVVTHPFNPYVAAMRAHQFVELMHHHLRMQKLLVGYDFALGKGREGDVQALKKLGNQFKFEVDVMPQVEIGGQIISSSQIRQLLREGEVETAALHLGRRYSLTGKVVKGSGRGHTIGIPTANLDIWNELVVPRTGVYACRVLYNGVFHGAVTNIGVRPTFEKDGVLPSVETHLLDFNADLYGRSLRLEFWHRLRDEQRFSDFQALVNQIQYDISRTREMLSVDPES
jgi:riboflavin kinase / FMN adenylyltransferase